ncbi:MAG TPA: hypothetical protein VKB03_11640 [Conexibacter sp.]|nr:hypothetical protein [Conexibacter sp.]
MRHGERAAMVAMSVFRREVQVLLQREIGRLRTCAITLSVAVLGFAAFAVPAGAAEVRHYEQVTPAEKGDSDIIAEGLSTMASEAGNAAAFESRLNFGDAVGSGTVGRTTYVARRVDGGWSTHSVSPMPRPDALQVLFASNRVEVFSEDLSTSLLWAYDLPAVTDDTPLHENLYVQDTATGALRTISVTQLDPLALFDFLNTSYRGVSADAKHVGFTTTTRMLPEAAPGVENVYKWDDGVLSVVGVLPDGSVPPAGASVSPENDRHTMSVDGTRLVFTASPDGTAPSQLYLHVDGRRTAWITEPERSDRDRTPPNGIRFEGMSPDGNSVFFISDDSLVDEDTAPGADLYRFTFSEDAASDDDNLTLITNNGSSNYDLGTGGTLVGMSDDARRVYIHQTDELLKVWQEGVPGLTIVDPLHAFRLTTVVERLTLLTAEPGHGRVSPDGSWFAYINQEGQMYLYGLRDQTLTCASCPSQASVVPTVTNTGGRRLRGFRPRFLSDDGQVFFTSTGNLLPQDTNGAADVYEYDGKTRTLSLLTSGKGRDPAMFVDASRSGDDVFVVTRQKLVKTDRDDYVDLYDVRVGPAPLDQPIDAAPACEADACQGTPSVAPSDDVLGSLSVEGDTTAGVRARLTARHRVRFRGATGVLSVKLSAAGRIAWRARGLASGSVRRGSAGTAKLRLRLGTSARAQLKSSGRYTTTLHVRFLASDGTQAARAVRVTFRVVAKKGR